MEYTDLYINGTWSKGTSGERFDVINPATEEVLASVASADIADADAALDAAEAAMKDWAAHTPRQRSEVLRKAWELMTAPMPLERQPMPPNFFAGSPKRLCGPTG
jgi:succinate-semialdehyde dehydrogenase/glutarate-semialdehyde dehydrogenase